MIRDRIPIFNVIVLVIFIVLLTFVSLKYVPVITEIINDSDQFREIIRSYGYGGVLVFILIQVLQIVIPVIPGEVVQIAAGYIFGTWLGTLYLVIGAVLGSTITFYAARFLGYPLVRAFASADRLERLSGVVKSSKSDLVIFFLFLLPGLPKDLLTYVGGVTPIHGPRFLLLTLVARMPALFASVIVGSNLHQGDYGLVLGVSVIATILFTVGFVYRERILMMIQSRKPDQG